MSDCGFYSEMEVEAIRKGTYAEAQAHARQRKLIIEEAAKDGTQVCATQTAQKVALIC